METGDPGSDYARPPQPPPEAPLEGLGAGRRGYTSLAWAVIVLVSGATMAAGLIEPEKVAEAGAPGMQQIMQRTQDWFGQYSLGAVELGMDPEEIFGQIERQLGDSFRGHLRNAILAGEFFSPQRAAEMLTSLDETGTSGDERALRATLAELYAAYAGKDFVVTHVAPERRKQLVAELGWFGRLALAPEGTPDRPARDALLSQAKATMVATLGGTVFGCGSLLVGCMLAGGFAVMALAGNLDRRLTIGLTYGGVYAETFALWLVTFLAASLLVGTLAPREMRFAVLLVVFPTSLVVLAWPVLRGVPWAQVRSDIGWTRGRGVIVELTYGFAAYLATLPLLLFGVLVMLLLMRIFSGALPEGEGPGPPGHPIFELLVEGRWSLRLQLMILACVMAPLVEETMYRGVLYRHLRELTAPLRVAASIVVSVLVSGFLFAIVHPQGPLAVPALGALAAGFALAREWRGSLVASMTAHGLNNGIVTGLVLVMF